MSGAEFMRVPQAAAFLKAKYGIGATKTLNKLRVVGGGPRYVKFGRAVCYCKTELDAWALNKMSAPLTSTSDNGWRGK
jgi:hypothetical protein